MIKYVLFAFALIRFSFAQENFIPVTENLIAENIPSLSKEYIKEVRAYTEARAASFIEWHPTKKEMLISTRFGNSSQLHSLAFAKAARKQLTFYDDPVTWATYDPKGNYLLFLKDDGGNEFTHIYKYDLSSKRTVALTSGEKVQNGSIVWSKKEERIAFTSTKRNKKDRDVYVMNPLDSSSVKLVMTNKGGGWNVADWDKTDTKLLIDERRSISETMIHILDLENGETKKVLPEKDEHTVYNAVAFHPTKNGIYLLTNKDHEFLRLAYYDLDTKKLSILSGNIPWDVERAKLSKDGTQMLFITNENGLSKMYLLQTSTNAVSQLSNIPMGVISGADWQDKTNTIGFSLTTYSASSDAFAYDVKTKQLVAWTESELGGMDVSQLEPPLLVKWKSFDGLEISGYLYKASKKFIGKRPVIISIHGGPESQSKPNFLGRMNYYLNELGISILFPNVRGSTGYGKTFVDSDNGFKRENPVKDIGALFDWIKQQPDLDDQRIMVTGGSYGGFLSLAVSYMYSDKIRCAIDVVGISNFNTFMKNTESYRRDLRRVEYGDERDTAMYAFLEKISPTNHVNEIKKPLFIVQGGNDPRVPYTEAEQMKTKIKENSGVVWYLMAKDEGHGFKKKGNMDFQFYATIEFIKRYLLN